MQSIWSEADLLHQIHINDYQLVYLHVELTLEECLLIIFYKFIGLTCLSH